MKTLADFEPLSKAEQALLEASVSGKLAVISTTRPTEATIDNTVRAAFIRSIALGEIADHPLHARSVQLYGTWVIDTLDLMGATINANLVLANCYLTESPNIHGLRLTGSLIFSGSALAGLNADRANIAGSVFLRHDFESNGEIRLLGATIGGSLNCRGAKLNVEKNTRALSADGVNITGDVFLDDSFESNGEIRLLNATIGGSLNCSGAKLDVEKNSQALSADRANIAGSVFLEDDFESTGSIRMPAAKVKGGFTIMNLSKPLDHLDLSDCTVGFLHDEPNAWGKDITLAGFEYDRLRGNHWTAQQRLDWLKKQAINYYGHKKAPNYFKPQPWQQLIKVLRQMGHEDDADTIAMAFEQRLYAIEKIKGAARPLHYLFGKLAGYGYKPLRLVGFMLFIWVTCGVLYWHAAYQGVFAPSNPLIFDNPVYETCHPADSSAGKTNNWYTCSTLKGEYTTFSPMAYSLDVILPLVDLGQEKDWGVFIDTPKAAIPEEFGHLHFNHFVRLAVWFEILFGWMASLLLVAVLTGLTKRE